MKIPKITAGTHQTENAETPWKPLSINCFISAGKAVSVAAVIDIPSTAARKLGQYLSE